MTLGLDLDGELEGEGGVEGGMNPSQPQKPLAKSRAQPGASESPQSIETFPKRAKRPGETGLANEARPGLGTRADAPGKPDRGAKFAELEVNSREGAPPTPPDQRPEPSEQDSDSLAQEEQRDTGVSGHSGGT